MLGIAVDATGLAPGDTVRLYHGRFTGQRARVAYTGKVQSCRPEITAILIDPGPPGWAIGDSVRVPPARVRFVKCGSGS